MGGFLSTLGQVGLALLDPEEQQRRMAAAATVRQVRPSPQATLEQGQRNGITGGTGGVSPSLGAAAANIPPIAASATPIAPASGAPAAIAPLPGYMTPRAPATNLAPASAAAGPAAAAILPVIGGAQRDRVPGSPALSDLARNPGNLLMAPPASSAAAANIAPIGSATSRAAAPLLDAYANRVSRLRSVMQDAAHREAEPEHADLAAAAAVPALSAIERNPGSMFMGPESDASSRAPGYMTSPAATNSAAAAAVIPPIAPGPAAGCYAQDLQQTGPTAAQKQAAGVPQTTQQKLLRGIEAAGVGVLSGRDAVPTALDFYGAPEKKAEQGWQTQVGQDKAAADLERQQQDDTRQASNDELNRRNVESEIAERDRRAQPDDPADKKLDGYVNDQGQQTLIFQRPDGSTYEKSFSKVQGKAEKLSDPFEAFAYGSPEEKQAAKDFLTFEKKTGAQYEKPDEIQERYGLYRKDPDAYKAMFGDRGGAQDQTQATRMLTYFDKRRKEITGDWTLDEPTRAQQLAEIDQLEQPYLNNAAGGGQGEDRVTVVSPSGQQGTIPRLQLPAAQKKGYSVAQ